MSNAQRNIHQPKIDAIVRESMSRHRPNQEASAAIGLSAKDLLNRIAVLNYRIEKLKDSWMLRPH
jgi:hypothetical protein